MHDRADDLLRVLAALQRSQAAWLEDLRTVATAQDPAFAAAFRRWQEELAMVALQVHRAEARLLDFVLAPGASLLPADGGPGTPEDRTSARRWAGLLTGWFTRLHLDGTYLRVERLRDLDQDPLPADIVTDLATLAELAEATAPVHVRLADERDLAILQDAAFTGIVAPWRVRGLPALHTVQAWLRETLDDEGDW
jgi:hypothetical protein